MVPMWLLVLGLSLVAGITVVVHAVSSAKTGAETMLKNYRTMLAESRKQLIEKLEKEQE